MKNDVLSTSLSYAIYMTHHLILNFKLNIEIQRKILHVFCVCVCVCTRALISGMQEMWLESAMGKILILESL